MAQLLKPNTLAGVSSVLRNIAPWFGFKPATEEPKRRNAAGLAQIAERFAPPEPAKPTWSKEEMERALHIAFGKAKARTEAEDASGNDSSSEKKS